MHEAMGGSFREMLYYSSAIEIINSQLKLLYKNNVCYVCDSELCSESKLECIESLSKRIRLLEKQRSIVSCDYVSFHCASNEQIDCVVREGCLVYLRQIKSDVLLNRSCPVCKYNLQNGIGVVLASLDRKQQNLQRNRVNSI